MSAVDEWLDENNRYLSNALRWLNLRLRQLAEKNAPALQPEPRYAIFNRRQPQVGEVSEREVAQAYEEMESALTGDAPPAMHVLVERFDLQPFERHILLLCAAMELDPNAALLCALIQDNAERRYPTFALALDLFPEWATWNALSPERPLRFWRLIDIIQTGASSLTSSVLRIDERILNNLKGLNYLDDRLDPLLVPFDVDGDGPPLPPSQQTALEAVTAQLRYAAGRGRPPVVQLVGPDPLSKQTIARQAAADLGLQLLRLPAALLPSQPAELESLARLWQRETLLLPIALYLDAHESGPGPEGEQQSQALHRLLVRDLGVVLLDTREVQPGLGHGGLPVDVDKPLPAEQHAAWQSALGDLGGEGLHRLASQFNLNLVTIQSVVDSALSGENKDAAQVQRDIWQTCLARSRPRLDLLAERIETKATWREIVLGREQRRLLYAIARQVTWRTQVYDDFGFRQRMNRGLGISALFAGESGTGKTMAAEVIANHLCLNLYRIDLSAVVSKYIGETEKNLRRLFDAAEDGGAILFFDEADALFGKRSEVKDSHDRYANIEINYLLQRMEAYGGLAILATNMKSALDPAFLRRLRFVVNFPFPTAADRKRIWQKAFPPEMPIEHNDPLSAVDFDWLARFNLTGGSIHNVALSAAFLAARAGRRVTMPLVLEAARAEFRKLEKPVNETDFNWKPRPGARPAPAEKSQEAVIG